MSRTGKIARLPAGIREQINLRLKDGENGQDVVAWLNSVDEVKAVLAEDFGGRPVTESNLSDWRLGGFRDWEAQEAALAEARLMVSEGGELADLGEKELADRMAVWLIGRYLLAARKLREKPDDPESWKLLRELCHDVVALRRGEHGVQWLQLKKERLKLQHRKQEFDFEKSREQAENKERRWSQILDSFTAAKVQRSQAQSK